MNKKYIDFVPAKKQVSRPVSTKKSQVGLERPKKRSVEMVAAEGDGLAGDVSRSGGFSIKKEPNYGVIEDFRPKFVKTEVKKRPLSRSHFTNSNTEINEAKSKIVGLKGVEKNVEKPDGIKKEEDKKSLKIPRSPFINQNKVKKRPLSKNVYEPKIKETTHIESGRAKGPVTIIDKPEKESKLGVFITIILTIILGAVAGTIAFLILPK